MSAPFFSVWYLRDLHFNYFSLAVAACCTILGSIISTLMQGVKFARVTVTSLGAGYARSGNVITASANGTLGSQDGVTLVVTDRVLLRSGNSDAGLYEVTSVGSGGTPFVLTRTSDADDSTEMVSGTLVYVRSGTSGSGYPDTLWRLVTEPPIVLNTDTLTFKMLSPQGVRLLAQEIYGRSSIRFISGTGATVSIADDAANDEVEVTIAAVGATIEEVDGSPSYTGIVTIRYDQADGFVVTQPGAGIARVDMVPATRTQAGNVSVSTQSWAGRKCADYLQGSIDPAVMASRHHGSTEHHHAGHARRLQIRRVVLHSRHVRFRQ